MDFQHGAQKFFISGTYEELVSGAAAGVSSRNKKKWDVNSSGLCQVTSHKPVINYNYLCFIAYIQKVEETTICL